MAHIEAVKIGSSDHRAIGKPGTCWEIAAIAVIGKSRFLFRFAGSE
jgi:hypothetical protein